MDGEDLGSQVARLREELRGLREVGAATVEVRDLREIPAGAAATTRALDAFASGLGLARLGDLWREVGRDQARALLVSALARDLAYGERTMEDGTAASVAERFLEMFGAQARCFTNTGPFVAGGGRSWTPLTAHTFDVGVAALGEKRIGLLLLADED
jgi:hypothetical protein